MMFSIRYLYFLLNILLVIFFSSFLSFYILANKPFARVQPTVQLFLYHVFFIISVGHFPPFVLYCTILFFLWCYCEF